MKIQNVILAGLLTVYPVMSGWANDELPRFEITPFGGYRMSGSLGLNDASYSRLDLGDGAVFGVSAGVRFESAEDFGEQALEVMWAHQNSSLRAIPKPGVMEQSVNMGVDQFHLNGLYYPPDFVRFLPYAIAGVGATVYAPRGDLQGQTRFSWALGGGVKIPIKRRLGLRLEAKWDPALAQTNGGIYCNTATGQCFTASSGNLINQFDFTAGLSVGF